MMTSSILVYLLSVQLLVLAHGSGLDFSKHSYGAASFYRMIKLKADELNHSLQAKRSLGDPFVHLVQLEETPELRPTQRFNRRIKIF